jgi:hypothetical protein
MAIKVGFLERYIETIDSDAEEREEMFEEKYRVLYEPHPGPRQDTEVVSGSGAMAA